MISNVPLQSEAQKKINDLAAANQAKAIDVLNRSDIVGICKRAGCRVNLIGSLKMHLLASHRDIDLHIYSPDLTTERSFAIMAEIAKNPDVTEIKCINGLHTDEHCIAWHIMYRSAENEIWRFDVIHIEKGTEYDGFFERMAERICSVITPDQRNAILRLKFETPADKNYHGVEYYEAVIADGITTMCEFEKWVIDHRKKPPYYWIP